MATNELNTDFAPAERESQRIVEKQAEMIARETPERFINGLPLPIVVVNDKRQIVYCNDKFEAFSCEHEQVLPLGRRPGEALGCAYAHINPGGCGTTRFCRFCGAARAILRSLEGEHSVQICRLMRRDEHQSCLDFQVFAQPLEVNGSSFVIFSIMDISHELRLESIRRKVLGDVRRRAEAINRMYVRISRDMGNEIRGGVFALGYASRQLLEEIDSQSRLFEAEEGILGVVEEHVDAREAFAEAVQGLRFAGVEIELEQTAPPEQPNPGRIYLHPDCADAQTVSDRQLLVYALRQLVENALEAVQGQGAVQLRCTRNDQTVGLRVHNPGALPENVRRQIFQRGFSTKGDGRGFGLYFARLLVRRYLNGELELLEHEPDTVFEVRLPRA